MWFSFSKSQGNRVLWFQDSTTWLQVTWLKSKVKYIVYLTWKEVLFHFFTAHLPGEDLHSLRISRLRYEDHPDHLMVNALPMIQPIYFVAHWSLSSFWGPSAQIYHIFPWQDSGMRLVCSLLNSKSKSAAFIPNYGLLKCSLTRSYVFRIFNNKNVVGKSKKMKTACYTQIFNKYMWVLHNTQLIK